MQLRWIERHKRKALKLDEGTAVQITDEDYEQVFFVPPVHPTGPYKVPDFLLNMPTVFPDIDSCCGCRWRRWLC
eukprot:12911544-Prorocentrum_lima.AAC.1